MKTNYIGLKNNFLSKVQNGYDYSQSNKNFWYNFYLDYFINLATNFFEYENLPESIDPLFLENKLISLGYIGFFETDYGLVCQGGTMSDGLDLYENPLVFTPVNSSTLKEFKFDKKEIMWWSDEIDNTKAVVIKNTNFAQPSLPFIQGFCEKLAETEQIIQVNRMQQMKPFVIVAEDSSLFSFKNFFNKILNGDPVIYIKKRKTKDGLDSDKQLNDYVQSIDTKVEFLLDKLNDEKQRIINQFLTTIGINNNGVDKSERLVSAEATANNGLINASLGVYLNARIKGVELLNNNFGLDVKVYPSKRIEMFNTEVIMNDLEQKQAEFYTDGEEVTKEEEIEVEE